MALETIKEVTGTGVAVPGSDIDTDRIIPARFMKCVTFDGLGEYLFYDVRHQEDGTKKQHPLNEEKFAGASLMISGINFGCGSSREHAPQAIYRAGFRALIAQSFAEIFFGNCVTLGMPCVTASAADIERLVTAVAADPEMEITINLETLEVTFDDDQFPISLPESAREAFLSGRWDPVGELLEGAAAVESTARHLSYFGS